MSWFLRFSQVEEELQDDIVDQSEEGGPSSQYFDGEEVNRIMEERLFGPLRTISEESLPSFLENIGQDSMRQLVASLAAAQRLDNFMDVVFRYDEDVVIDGSEYALQQLSLWFDAFDAVGGSRSPLDSLRNEVQNVTGQ